MVDYTITLYKDEFPALIWDPKKKEFRVINPLKLPPEAYETLIPDTAINYQNIDKRYEHNCLVFGNFLISYVLSSTVPIGRVIKECDGSPDSVIKAYTQLHDGCRLSTSHKFVLTVGDCSSTARY